MKTIVYNKGYLTLWQNYMSMESKQIYKAVYDIVKQTKDGTKKYRIICRKDVNIIVA